jgi:glycosyltransferase involved in cell wall biosynthesis
MLAGCWRRPIVLVQTMHGWGIAKTTLQAATDVGVMNLMDVVVTPSQSSRATLVAQGVNPSRIRVVPYGVDAGDEAFHSGDTDLAADMWERRRNGAFVIACVGSVGLRKNQRLLVEAIARLRAPGATVTMFLGEGDTAQLQQFAEAAGVAGDVRVCGYTPGARRLAREADVLILPSRSEGQPVSILEAFCDRTLVIAANIPELTELVSHSRTGLLFTADNAASLADAIVSARSLAPGERRAIVDRARLRYEARFSLQAMIDGYLTIYDAQVGRTPAMRRAG